MRRRGEGGRGRQLEEEEEEEDMDVERGKVKGRIAMSFEKFKSIKMLINLQL